MCEQRHDIHISKTESTLLWCPADNCIIVYWSYNWDILRHMCTYHHYQPSSSSSSSSYYYTIDSYPSPRQAHPCLHILLPRQLSSTSLTRACSRGRKAVFGAPQESLHYMAARSVYTLPAWNHGRDSSHFLLFWFVWITHTKQDLWSIECTCTCRCTMSHMLQVKNLGHVHEQYWRKNLSIHAQLWCL